LAIYIPQHFKDKIFYWDEFQSVYVHRDVLIGRGVFNTIMLTSGAAFSKAILLNNGQINTGDDSPNIKGLLVLNNLSYNVEISPVLYTGKPQEQEYSIRLRIILEFSATKN